MFILAQRWLIDSTYAEQFYVVHVCNTFSPYHVCAALTAILSQAGPGPQQQHHFVSSSLDQFDSPCMGNAACRLSVNLHYLISNLSAKEWQKHTQSLTTNVTLKSDAAAAEHAYAPSRTEALG